MDLCLDRGRPVSVVVDDETVTPLAELGELVDVGVLDRSIEVTSLRVVRQPDPIVRVGEDHVGVRQPVQRPVEPRTATGEPVGPTGDAFERQPLLGEHRGRWERARPLHLGDRPADHHQRAHPVVQIRIERSQRLADRVGGFQVADVAAIGVVPLVRCEIPKHAQTQRRFVGAAQPAQQGVLQEVADIACVSILHIPSRSWLPGCVAEPSCARLGH